jgi:hypothetical protein
MNVESCGMSDLWELMKNKEIAEPLFWWAGIMLPFVTFGAIVYARAQVTVIAKQARATLLLDLIDKWNNAEMQAAKKVFQEIDKHARDIVFAANSQLDGPATMEKLQTHLYGEITELSNKEPEKYHVLSRLMNFFETAGMLVKRGYVSIDDIDGLFRGPIIQTGLMFTVHIEEKQKEKGIPPGLYENALFLIGKLRDRCP